MTLRDHALPLRLPFPVTLAGEPSRFDTPANRTLRNSNRLTIPQIRPAIKGSTDTSVRSSFCTICSDVAPLHLANVLTSLESTLTENTPITPLQSVLPKSLHFKPFRIRTYEKRWGSGTSQNSKPVVVIQRPGGSFSAFNCRLSLEFPHEMGCIGSRARWHSRFPCAQRSAQDFYA